MKDGHMSNALVFQRKKTTCQKIIPHNKYMTKERRNKYGKVGDYKYERWGTTSTKGGYDRGN
jgi:hypothetical protein